MEQSIDQSNNGLSFWGATFLLVFYRVLIGFLVAMAGATILGIVGEYQTISEAQWSSMFSFFLDIVAEPLIILCVYYSAKKKGLEKLNYVGNAKTQSYLWIIIVFLGYIMFFKNTIALPLERIEVSQSFIEAMEIRLTVPILFMFSVAVLAPVFEEILFRGIILESFLKRYKEGYSTIIYNIYDRGFNLIHFLIGILLLTLSVLFYIKKPYLITKKVKTLT
ncbi:CPBP family intramembrane glutamic endopeptidase [Serpentinicella sp. ANB-PHB4]|uniref:CPBP family intramembrane glutamic endopeptidase n=1 Tax=Serpentinicella sp. ANB-PHB4 TaxID=3074076 RepID=UPI00285E9D53|nr:CPBP family intramembrane glutamic endopeptidase [Serpentinicella sp. ANB-PHB4]MDR5659583.1 CPBP family intramembrane glutamic endopeptidase [Serpentinicella sp. ANB-PHB4]